MSKDEFLDILRESLEGQISLAEIENNVNYYQNYILNRSDGKTEEEHLKELGDPRLIARTIIDTAKDKKVNDNVYHNSDMEKRENNREKRFDNTSSMHYFTLNNFSWLQKAILIAIIALIMMVIISIIAAGISFLFSVVLPVLLFIVVPVFLVLGWWKNLHNR